MNNQSQVIPWGRDQLMVAAAVRYCLGRQTYIVRDCVEWLIEIWPLLDDPTKRQVRRDVEEKFAEDDSCRVEKHRYRPLGSSYDRAEWERVRQLWVSN